MRAFTMVILALLVAFVAIPAYANGARPATTPAQPAAPGAGPAQPAAPGAGPMDQQPMQPSTTILSPQMMDACLMNTYGLTRQQLSDLRAQGLSDNEIAMAAAIANRANVPISTVVSDYRSLGNWSSVMARYNVTMADLSIMPVAANMDVESFNRAFISQYYGIADSDIVQLRQQGHNWGTVHMLANAACRTNQSISTVASLHNQGMTWSQIAGRYNVAVTDFTSPCPQRTVVATRPVIGAGPTVMPGPTVMYDRNCNIILTNDDAHRYYRMGYDWLDVAIAANIRSHAGIPMDTTLNKIRQGGTWDDLIREYGVDPGVAFNVADYPFQRVSIYSESTQMRNLNRIQRYQRAGTAPVCPRSAGTIQAPLMTVPPAGAGPMQQQDHQQHH